MFTTIFVLLFGQNLSEINYKFMKKDSVVNLKKSKDDNNRYEFIFNFQFISDDRIKHPLLKDDNICLCKEKTKKLNNIEIFSDTDFQYLYFLNTKKYVYVTFSYGYVITDGKTSQEQLKDMVLQTVCSSITDLNISFDNIKVDVIIPQGKSFFDGKVGEGVGLGGRKLP